MKGDLYTLYNTNSQGPPPLHDYIEGQNERSSYSILQDNHSLKKQSAKMIKTLNSELRQYNKMRNSIDQTYKVLEDGNSSNDEDYQLHKKYKDYNY